MALNLSKLGGSVPTTQETEMKGGESTSGIKLGKMVNAARVKQIVNKQNLVYVSKLSPFCRFFKLACLSYFVILIITLVLLISNNNACGLDADNHILRMRNQTGPISCDGLYLANKTVETFPIHNSGLVDKVRLVNLSLPDAMDISGTDSGTLKLMNASTNITAEEFPLAMVFNYTVVENKSYIDGLMFETKADSSIEDNGAAFDVIISNSKRAPIRTNESWFNLDVWTDKKGKHYSYEAKPGKEATFKALDRCGSKFYLNDSISTRWNMAPITSPLSIMPVWFIGLEGLTEKQDGCRAPYSLSFRLQPWYCFAPLLIRSIPYQDITFSNVSFGGELIMDFDEHSAAKDMTMTFATASVDRIYLTKGAPAGKKIKIDSKQSNVSFYIPHLAATYSENVLDFYGLSGNVTTTETAENLYQINYKVQKNIESPLVMEVTRYNRTVALTTTTNAGMTTATVKIGDDSTITMSFETSSWALTWDASASETITLSKK